ncbi:MAG: hypothetical protein QOF70_995 [Acetobacteraceae bacterium]|jgi:hypothetical protein|nr:hypothetical protein [Acetobacteraceae bacterium]
MRETRLSGSLLNEPVGETTAGMICVSPRRYPVMTGRLQVKQQKAAPRSFSDFYHLPATGRGGGRSLRLWQSPQME